MKKALFACLTLFSFSTARAADTAELLPAHRHSVESLVRVAPSYRAWKLSLAPVIAGQALDVASSYNRLEVNPILAGQNGRFGAKGAAIKIGASTAILAAEYLIVRKNPGSARIFSKFNWVAGFVTIGVAAHNFAIR